MRTVITMTKWLTRTLIDRHECHSKRCLQIMAECGFRSPRSTRLQKTRRINCRQRAKHRIACDRIAIFASYPNRSQSRHTNHARRTFKLIIVFLLRTSKIIAPYTCIHIHVSPNGKSWSTKSTDLVVNVSHCPNRRASAILLQRNRIMPDISAVHLLRACGRAKRWPKLNSW